MHTRDAIDLLALAAIWGASFLLTRQGVPEFGPLALVGVRVAGGALVLLPLALRAGAALTLRSRWKDWLLLGALNAALPFACLAYASQTLGPGPCSIFNATAPMFAALIAAAAGSERLTLLRAGGLALAFAGVVILIGGQWSQAAASGAFALASAVAACLLAALSYAVSAVYSRQKLHGVAPLAVAGGSQLGAAAWIAVPAALAWPAAMPSAGAWAGAAVLALLCTGVAYVLYFRLIARVGPSNAIAVTYLIPLFAGGWGWLVLDEPVSAGMGVGGAVVLVGCALATGLLPRSALPAVRVAPQAD